MKRLQNASTPKMVTQNQRYLEKTGQPTWFEETEMEQHTPVRPGVNEKRGIKRLQNASTPREITQNQRYVEKTANVDLSEATEMIEDIVIRPGFDETDKRNNNKYPIKMVEVTMRELIQQSDEAYAVALRRADFRNLSEVWRTQAERFITVLECEPSKPARQRTRRLWRQWMQDNSDCMLQGSKGDSRNSYLGGSLVKNGPYGNKNAKNGPGAYGIKNAKKSPGAYGNKNAKNAPGGYGNKYAKNQPGAYGDQNFNSEPGENFRKNDQKRPGVNGDKSLPRDATKPKKMRPRRNAQKQLKRRINEYLEDGCSGKLESIANITNALNSSARQNKDKGMFKRNNNGKQRKGNNRGFKANPDLQKFYGNEYL